MPIDEVVPDVPVIVEEEKPIEPQIEAVEEIPIEAGRVVSMCVVGTRIIVAFEYSVYELEKDINQKDKLKPILLGRKPDPIPQSF